MFERLRSFGRRFTRGGSWGGPVLSRWRWGLGVFFVPAVGVFVFRGGLLGILLLIATVIALIGMVLAGRWIARLGRDEEGPPPRPPSET